PFRLFVFFFQAEDGIRDLTVTGVQTCALPISTHRATADGRDQPRGSAVNVGGGVRVGPVTDVSRGCAGRNAEAEAAAAAPAQVRSEERRVGKECRSRWSPEQ